MIVRTTGVREHVEAARSKQAGEPSEDQFTGRTVSQASLPTDLELAREKNRSLRAERDQLGEAQ